MIAFRIDPAHDSDHCTLRASATPDAELCRECDTRARRVLAQGCTAHHRAVLWTILYACLSRPGRALEWREIVASASEEANRRIVAELVTWGIAHAAGLCVDISGYAPTFMAPARRKPR